MVPAILEEEAGALSEWLSAQRGASVEIRVPKKGNKRHEMTLACANAKLAMEQAKIERARDKGRVEAAIAELALALGLEKYPLRVECYDISTMGGAASVGSLVVFQDGYPARRDYRKFSIKFTPGIDDIGMMREVLHRRFKRFLNESEMSVGGKTPAQGWATKPDLILLDGGKGQLGAGIDVLGVLGIEGVEIAALAKRLEVVYRPGVPEPILLPRDSEALFLFQRIRDEAHRVAVSYHRSIMQKATASSWLDQVTGVGPGRKKALMRHLGSPRRILEASLEDIEGVPGVSENVAVAVYQAAKLVKGGSGGKT
jgi:excinuclease ABC subunit C